ncbi:transcription initiation factor tfiid subunit taf12 [Vairimorpha apis BRL 01]|uniref:Transcription initiation factor tfiid subunit taf12 n=1 Tax=Vairimorpha apis BRL 01 TaxID=1037528 RepID=T0MIC2_9MICR|nr:transcription initiation factor tfiid subunit taf12 [Vairimorpha apis BRL 01]
MNYEHEGQKIKEQFNMLIKQYKKHEKRKSETHHLDPEFQLKDEQLNAEISLFYKKYGNFIRKRKNSIGVFSVEDFVAYYKSNDLNNLTNEKKNNNFVYINHDNLSTQNLQNNYRQFDTQSTSGNILNISHNAIDENIKSGKIEKNERLHNSQFDKSDEILKNNYSYDIKTSDNKIIDNSIKIEHTKKFSNDEIFTEKQVFSKKDIFDDNKSTFDYAPIKYQKLEEYSEDTSNEFKFNNNIKNPSIINNDKDSFVFSNEINNNSLSSFRGNFNSSADINKNNFFNTVNNTNLGFLNSYKSVKDPRIQNPISPYNYSHIVNNNIRYTNKTNIPNQYTTQRKYTHMPTTYTTPLEIFRPSNKFSISHSNVNSKFRTINGTYENFNQINLNKQTHQQYLPLRPNFSPNSIPQRNNFMESRSPVNNYLNISSNIPSNMINSGYNKNHIYNHTISGRHLNLSHKPSLKFPNNSIYRKENFSHNIRKPLLNNQHISPQFYPHNQRNISPNEQFIIYDKYIGSGLSMDEVIKDKRVKINTPKSPSINNKFIALNNNVEKFNNYCGDVNQEFEYLETYLKEVGNEDDKLDMEAKDLLYSICDNFIEHTLVMTNLMIRNMGKRNFNKEDIKTIFKIEYGIEFPE